MKKKFFYFFILGKNPTLSIAEICSQIKADIYELSAEFLILETEKEIDVFALQEKLGGTIKIGHVLTQTDTDLTGVNIDYFLKNLPMRGKIYFGFSLYGDEGKIKGLKLKIKSLALKIKKELKENGIPSRWVTSSKRTLSSVIVQKNKLLTSGAEFCFLLNSGVDLNRNKLTEETRAVFIGKTLTCQKFEEYEFYDFKRPKRKIEQGMLPPKLAKIMINLSQTPKNGIILDPFCGSGTIIQEAMRMGYTNLIATDINEVAIKDSQENIKWLLMNPKSKIQNPKSKIIIQKCNVKELSQLLAKNLVDVIVSEPYLGPLKLPNSRVEISNLIKELSDLYLAAFREFKKVLKPNASVVIIFPIFQMAGRLHSLPILEELKRDGWQIINPIPLELRKSPVIKITSRGSIVYSRPDQRILREIFVFKN
jgi:tRNA G10  N-methylase Trm11